MGITLDAVTLSTCEENTPLAVTGWTTTDTSGPIFQYSNGNESDSGEYPPREGDDCIEWGADDNETIEIKSPTFTAFDIRVWIMGIWFLLPAASNSEDYILDSGADSLKIRAYDASGNWADYYMGGRNDYVGGWTYLYVCGDDPTNGPFGGAESTTPPNYGAIVQMSVFTRNAPGAVNDSAKGDAYYAIDWLHRYTTVEITGDNGGSPWTLEDVYQEAIRYNAANKPIWGCVEKTDIAYTFFAGIDFGDGTSTDFADENKYLYIKPYNVDVPCPIAIKNNADVRFGKKQGNYAVNGCQIIHALSQQATFDVELGGILKAYACRIENWGNVQLGNNGTALIELVKCDFYKNDSVRFQTTGMLLDDVRCHLDSPLATDIVGIISRAPTSPFINLRVFSVGEGFQFTADNITIDGYVASSHASGYDFSISNGLTVNLVSSTFSPSKTKVI